MTQERSRQIGRALMALSIVQAIAFFIAATRRSYLALAVPVGIAVGCMAGLGFWVGYTMATTDWDHPADFGTEPAPADVASEEIPAAEGAPPPDTLAD